MLKNSPISSLGFDYSSYYTPGMTSPRDLKEPTTRWTAGTPTFEEYINDVYIPVQDREVRNGSSTLIYQKRTNAGIANQIMGVCDTLILGVVYNRSVQSASP